MHSLSKAHLQHAEHRCSTAYHAVEPVHPTPHARFTWVAKICPFLAAMFFTSGAFEVLLQIKTGFACSIQQSLLRRLGWQSRAFAT